MLLMKSFYLVFLLWIVLENRLADLNGCCDDQFDATFDGESQRIGNGIISRF